MKRLTHFYGSPVLWLIALLALPYLALGGSITGRISGPADFGTV